MYRNKNNYYIGLLTENEVRGQTEILQNVMGRGVIMCVFRQCKCMGDYSDFIPRLIFPRLISPRDKIHQM